ncbi:hypothetical protein B0H13DRAFT_2391323 [Mycena leptocephala]|nr:hypothetical protein B0H13DRAFT_2391323 [Mycena leptocephala]
MFITLLARIPLLSTCTAASGPTRFVSCARLLRRLEHHAVLIIARDTYVAVPPPAAAGCIYFDLDSREDNGNRWSVRWSTSNDGGKTKRVLLQCDCGYDHRLAGSKKRRTAVDFTGCLAHAEITNEIVNGLRVAATRYDTRSLYRQFSRLHGYALASAIFHYSPRATKEECLEVFISTDEMKEAAWKHGYRSQIVVDGTFGVCDSRLLLFIVMGINEDKKGVPLAFLLFSAPAGNQVSKEFL